MHAVHGEVNHHSCHWVGAVCARERFDSSCPPCWDSLGLWHTTLWRSPAYETRAYAPRPHITWSHTAPYRTALRSPQSAKPPDLSIPNAKPTSNFSQRSRRLPDGSGTSLTEVGGCHLSAVDGGCRLQVGSQADGRSWRSEQGGRCGSGSGAGAGPRAGDVEELVDVVEAGDMADVK